jgi:hypothetical protein
VLVTDIHKKVGNLCRQDIFRHRLPRVNAQIRGNVYYVVAVAHSVSEDVYQAKFILRDTALVEYYVSGFAAAAEDSEAVISEPLSSGVKVYSEINPLQA